MEKLLVTKKQAIALITQAQELQKGRGNGGLDIMASVPDNHPLYKWDIKKLETRLYEYVSEDEIAGIVEIVVE